MPNTLTWPDGREIVWRREGERYTQCTFSHRQSFKAGSVMVWTGIFSEARTELYMIMDRYINGILQDYVVPYDRSIYWRQFSTDA